jgi:tetratricopeptide (TPR) repeat protein
MKSLKKEGEGYLRQGDYASAEKAFLAALAEAEKSHQPNAYTILQLKVVGVFYFAMGQLPKAEDYLKRALSFERLRFGPESLEICSGLNLMGLLSHVMQQYEAAEHAYQEALQIQEKTAFAKVPEANSRTFHMSLHHLAMVYCTQGRGTEALSLCKQASDRIGKISGPGGRDLSIDFQNIAVNCCLEGRQNEAFQTCQWMLDLCFRELQREFLGIIIEKGGLGSLGARPDHLKQDEETLEYLYHEVWRPVEQYQKSTVTAPSGKGISPKQRKESVTTPTVELPQPDSEDYWRPGSRESGRNES